MAVSEIVGSWSLLCRQSYSGIEQYQLGPNSMLIRFNAATRWSERSSCVVARAQNSNTSPQEEDLWYVGKLAVGSIAGGAVIKYGSALFPEITTPNIVAALIIIATPVIVAVLLLIKESLPKP